MTQENALMLADEAAHKPDGTSQALARLARDLRRAKQRVASLEACSQMVPLAGMVYEP